MPKINSRQILDLMRIIKNLNDIKKQKVIFIVFFVDF